MKNHILMNEWENCPLHPFFSYWREEAEQAIVPPLYTPIIFMRLNGHVHIVDGVKRAVWAYYHQIDLPAMEIKTSQDWGKEWARLRLHLNHRGIFFTPLEKILFLWQMRNSTDLAFFFKLFQIPFKKQILIWLENIPIESELFLESLEKKQLRLENLESWLLFGQNDRDALVSYLRDYQLNQNQERKVIESFWMLQQNWSLILDEILADFAIPDDLNGPQRNHWLLEQLDARLNPRLRSVRLKQAEIIQKIRVSTGIVVQPLDSGEENEFRWQLTATSQKQFLKQLNLLFDIAENPLCDQLFRIYDAATDERYPFSQ